MLIKKHKRFEKAFRKLDTKIQDKVSATLVLFIENKYNVLLNNHSLKWHFVWLSSINVSWDIRIIFREIEDSEIEIIELLNLGTHSELY